MPRSYTIHEDGTVEVHSPAIEASVARVETAQPSSERYDTHAWLLGCELCGGSHGTVEGPGGATFCQTVAGALRLRLTKCPVCSLFVESIYRHQPSCRKVPFATPARVHQESPRAGATPGSGPVPGGRISRREQRRLKKAQEEQALAARANATPVRVSAAVQQPPAKKKIPDDRPQCPRCKIRPKNLAKHLRKAHSPALTPTYVPAKQAVLPKAVDDRVLVRDRPPASAVSPPAGQPQKKGRAVAPKLAPVSTGKPVGGSAPHSEQKAAVPILVDDITTCPECGLFVVLSMLQRHNQARHPGVASAAPPATQVTTALPSTHDLSRSSISDSPSREPRDATQLDTGRAPSGQGGNRASAKTSDAKRHPRPPRRDKWTQASKYNGRGSGERGTATSLPAPDVLSPPERKVFIDPWTGKPISAAEYNRLYRRSSPRPVQEHQVYSQKVTAPEPPAKNKGSSGRRGEESTADRGTRAYDGRRAEAQGGRRIAPAPTMDEARLDGSLRLGYLAREQGKFGSLGSWDNYSDDSKP